MAEFEITERAEADVSEILEYTLHHWGEEQCFEYSELIEEAFSTIAEDPTRGRPRFHLRPGVFAFRLGRPGRNARHVVFYTYDRREERVTILRVLHGSMDFARRLRAAR